MANQHSHAFPEVSTLRRMAQDAAVAGTGHRSGDDRHRSGAISVRGLRKEFDGVTAVDGIDIEIGSGEFFTLLGPSGCGKTTTLRMLAGFEQPTDRSEERRVGKECRSRW